jgi:hypothetical protein
VAPGEEGAALGRPLSLARHGGEYEDDEGGSNQLGPPGRQGGTEVVRPHQRVDRLEEDQPGGGSDAEGAGRHERGRAAPYRCLSCGQLGNDGGHARSIQRMYGRRRAGDSPGVARRCSRYGVPSGVAGAAPSARQRSQAW